MHKILKLFGFSAVCVGAVLAVSDAGAAEELRGNARGAVNVTSSRMPSMPVMPINTTGNMVINTGSGGGGGVIVTPPQPPKPKCADGGVENSDYKVEDCMNEVLSCVNGGALPGGLNDLFNEDLRNAIFNGMSLCSIQVEKCITTVRKDCSNVYRTSADVWIDFNSRKVQPEYYSFVLRKTGLTPHQAENTCWLLDKNTYGSSFNAVANSGSVTAEYAQGVGAYNKQAGGTLIKNNPQGVTVNNGNPGVDGQRGHYARWDATKAECHIRVAAYNKDKHITNTWLFGALGDDKPAEVWKKAGDTFSCNKDMFGFGLMNKTATTAVVGVGGGTLVGAGVGALAGHGNRTLDCSNDSKHLKQMYKDLRNTGNIAVLNDYMDNKISVNANTLTPEQCEEVGRLYNLYANATTRADKNCDELSISGRLEVPDAVVAYKHQFKKDANGNIDYTRYYPDTTRPDFAVEIREISPENKAVLDAGEFPIPAVTKEATIKNYNNAKKNCPEFKPINKAKMIGAVDSMYCDKDLSNDCIRGEVFDKEIARMGGALGSKDYLESNMLKSTLIGAGAGAAAGGLATAITAFVEKNNISCRVGDGLETVGFGKSHSIGSLKDFYVKWNLRLPDTIMPTGQANDCDTWKNSCGTLKDLNQCAIAQLNYKSATGNTIELINNACAVSGSVCIENYPVAKSHGVCK